MAHSNAVVEFPEDEKFNLLRFAEKKDPTLHEWAIQHRFERLLTTAGMTVIRPSDAVLTKQTKEMGAVVAKLKAAKKGPTEPEYLFQLKEAQRYILKGNITPEHLHASNVYVSIAEEGYGVYFDGNGPNVFLCTEIAATPAAQKKGTPAKLTLVAANGSSIYTISGELPKGFKPEHPRLNLPRTGPPPSSASAVGGKRKKHPKKLPHLKRRGKGKGKGKKRRHMIGGGGEGMTEMDGQECLCDSPTLGGGGDEPTFTKGSREAIKTHLREGLEEIKFAPLGDGWAEYFVRSFMGYLLSGKSQAGEKGTERAKDLQTLLSGKFDVDADTLLAPHRDRSEPDSPPLVSDEELMDWYDMWHESPDQAKEYMDKFGKTALNKLLLGGAGREFVRARGKHHKKLKRKLRRAIDQEGGGGSGGLRGEADDDNSDTDEKGGVDDDKKRPKIEDLLKSISAAYDEMASNNTLDGAQVLPSATFAHLKKRLGKHFAPFLAHSNLRLALSEEMSRSGTMTKSEMENVLAWALPGCNYKREYEAFLSEKECADSAFRYIGRGILAGVFPYVRADVDALDVLAQTGGGAGGGPLDMKYRVFDFDSFDFGEPEKSSPPSETKPSPPSETKPSPADVPKDGKEEKDEGSESESSSGSSSSESEEESPVGEMDAVHKKKKHHHKTGKSGKKDGKKGKKGKKAKKHKRSMADLLS